MAQLEGIKDPCVRLDKALYGHPRAGFDWFATLDDLLTCKLGWDRVPGFDSVYTKNDAMVAAYVDDLVLAGTGHARRREWAAIQKSLKLRAAPEPLSRFLGVKFSVCATSPFVRRLTMCQDEYARSLVEKYNAQAAHPAGHRATPAVKAGSARSDAGLLGGYCRTLVGGLMYLSRATRPDVTYATNWLARHVSSWTTRQDRDAEQLVGYLRSTAECGLEARVDVRDKKGKVWLELWVDADHAGEHERRSTTVWVLLLKGEHGNKRTHSLGQARARGSIQRRG